MYIRTCCHTSLKVSIFDKTIITLKLVTYILQGPPITNPCTTLPVAGYYIHAIVTNSSGDANERIYTSNYIDESLADSMGRFNVSYNDSFDQELEPNANYAFIVNTQNNVVEIPRTGTCPSCGKLP